MKPGAEAQVEVAVAQAETEIAGRLKCRRYSAGKRRRWRQRQQVAAAGMQQHAMVLGRRRAAEAAPQVSRVPRPHPWRCTLNKKTVTKKSMIILNHHARQTKKSHSMQHITT
jgi:hypothetical protein